MIIGGYNLIYKDKKNMIKIKKLNENWGTEKFYDLKGFDMSYVEMLELCKKYESLKERLQDIVTEKWCKKNGIKRFKDCVITKIEEHNGQMYVEFTDGEFENDEYLYLDKSDIEK